MKPNKIPIELVDICGRDVKANFKQFQNSDEFAKYLRDVIRDNNLNISEVEFARLILTYCHEVIMFNQTPFNTNNDFLFRSMFNKKDPYSYE